MRLLVWILCLIPSLARAGGVPADGINWFTIGDPHSLAMAWFMLNFLLFAGGLALVIRGPIMRQVRERAERFEKLLRAAEEAREEAEKRQAELQARLDGLSSEIDELRKTTEDKLEREKALIMANAEDEISRLQKNAEIALGRQRRNAERRLTAEAARLAYSAAHERVTQAVNESDHDRLNSEFVANVEGQA
jgi:F0F1-type ATP synthase membrane subunit b/b'